MAIDGAGRLLQHSSRPPREAVRATPRCMSSHGTSADDAHGGLQRSLGRGLFEGDGFLLQEVPEQWENSVLGFIQAVVARRGRTRRRVAIAFEAGVWRLETQSDGEGWLQCVLRHRVSQQIVKVVNVPHKQYNLQSFVKPLTEINQTSVARRIVGGEATSTKTVGTTLRAAGRRLRDSWSIGAWRSCWIGSRSTGHTSSGVASFAGG